MIKIDNKKSIAEYTRQLAKINKWALPDAIADCLNVISTGAKMQSRKNFAESSKNLREPRMLNGIITWDAKPKPDIRKINAVLGAVLSNPKHAGYGPGSRYDVWGNTEFGAVIKPIRGSFIAKPTLGPRRGNAHNIIRGRYRMGKMGEIMKAPNLDRWGNRMGKRQQIAAQIAMARRQNYKGFMAIPFDERPGIYKRGAGDKLEIMRDFRYRKFRMGGKHWMGRAVDVWATRSRMDMAFQRAAERRISGIITQYNSKMRSSLKSQGKFHSRKLDRGAGPVSPSERGAFLEKHWRK